MCLAQCTKFCFCFLLFINDAFVAKKKKITFTINEKNYKILFSTKKTINLKLAKKKRN